MLGRLDHFSIPFDFKKVGDVEARKTFQQIELILQRLAREASLSITSTLAATVLDDLADVTITAAANNDFLKYDGGSNQWINFPLFTTANTWGATQNVQSLVPTANAAFDLGTALNNFRTLFLDNNGGTVLQHPTAQGTGGVTSYIFRVGGGATDDTEGGLYTLVFDGLPTAHAGAGNELRIDFGTGSLASDTSRLVIAGDYTLGGLGPGPVEFRIAASGFLTSFGLFAPSISAGSIAMGFRNTVGNLQFGTQSPTAGTKTQIRFNDSDEGLGAISEDVFIRFLSVANASALLIDTEALSQTAAFSVGRNILFGSTGVARRIDSKFEVCNPSTVGYTIDTPAFGGQTFALIRGGRTGGGSVTAITALTTLATAFFSEPIIVLGGGGSVTNAVTVYIENAPTEGTNNYALFVDAGDTRLDGSLIVGATAGAQLSAAAAVFTMAGLGGTPENLTFDLSGTVANTVTVASTTGVTDFILSFANVRTTTKLEIDGNLDHDGTQIGFFGVAPVNRAAAYVQNFATADRTLNAYTADDESAAYTGIDNLQVGTVYAQVADLNALRVAYENLRAFVEDAVQMLNALVDDNQAYGLLQ